MLTAIAGSGSSIALGHWCPKRTKDWSSTELSWCFHKFYFAQVAWGYCINKLTRQYVLIPIEDSMEPCCLLCKTIVPRQSWFSCSFEILKLFHNGRIMHNNGQHKSFNLKTYAELWCKQFVRSKGFDVRLEFGNVRGFRPKNSGKALNTWNDVLLNGKQRSSSKNCPVPLDAPEHWH